MSPLPRSSEPIPTERGSPIANLTAKLTDASTITHTSFPGTLSSPDHGDGQIQGILFNVLTVCLAFATLIMACLQYRKKHHALAVELGESHQADSGVSLEEIPHGPGEVVSASPVDTATQTGGSQGRLSSESPEDAGVRRNDNTTTAPR